MLIVLVIGVAHCCFPANAEKKETTKMISTGVAADRGEDGSTAAVVLNGNDWRHSIDLNGVAEELLSFVDESGAVEGVV
jgi:hypothetical protein